VFSVAVVFFGLTYDFFQKYRTIQDVVLLLLILSAPIPLTVFMAFAMAVSNNDITSKDYSGNTFNAIIFLIVGFVFIFVITLILKEYLYEDNMKIGFPLFVNSAVISLYVVNYYQVRSISLAGFLTGASFGVVLYVVFLM